MNSQTFKSSDLALCAALSIFYPVSSIERSNPRKVYFVFEKTEGLDELINQYWRSELRLEAQAYFNQIKTLKARVYEYSG